MKRSSGVTIIAILSMFGSVCTLLAGVLVAFAFKMAPKAQAPSPLTDTTNKSIMVFIVLFFAAWAVWGISTSIGIFRLKKWARTSVLVFSVQLALVGLLMAIFFAAMPFPVAPNQLTNQAFMASVRITIAAYYLVLAMIGIWWLIFFNRKSVKQQFAGDGLALADSDSSNRPLSITVIACYCLLSAATMLPRIFLRFPAVPFSFVLTGTAALLAYLGYLAINIYIGVGLLRLNPQARVVAIAYSLLAIASSLLFYIVPGYPSRLQRMVAANPGSLAQNLPVPAFTSFVIGFTVLITLALIGVGLYFLITRKSAFDKPAPAPNMIVPR